VPVAKTVGRDLFDGLDGLLEASDGPMGKAQRSAPKKKPPRSNEQPRPKVVKRARPGSPAVGPIRRERLTVHVDVALSDALRNAVYWTPGLTVAGLVERGIKSELAGLVKANGGKPFDQRPEELKAGRPVR
jgi:hypothetical protein